MSSKINLLVGSIGLFFLLSALSFIPIGLGLWFIDHQVDKIVETKETKETPATASTTTSFTTQTVTVPNPTDAIEQQAYRHFVNQGIPASSLNLWCETLDLNQDGWFRCIGTQTDPVRKIYETECSPKECRD